MAARLTVLGLIIARLLGESLYIPWYPFAMMTDINSSTRFAKSTCCVHLNCSFLTCLFGPSSCRVTCSSGRESIYNHGMVWSIEIL